MFGGMSVDLTRSLLEKHGYIMQVSRALHNIAPWKLATILEWEPLVSNRARLFAEAIRTKTQRVIGGITVAHFMHLARKHGVPQAILAEFARERRLNPKLNGAVIRQTHILVDILVEKATPFLMNRSSAAFDGELMEATVI